MTQLYLSGPSEAGPDAEPPADGVIRLQFLVTVKAAPRFAGLLDGTLCVAGISTYPHRPGWTCLYPIRLRDLVRHEGFQNYDIISVDARPGHPDGHRERWRPALHTVRTEHHLKQWKLRQRWLEPYVEGSMCRLERPRPGGPHDAALALVRPREVAGLRLLPHPDRSVPDRRGPDRYDNPATRLRDRQAGLAAPPRFRGFYRYRCDERTCPGHRQEILDWEFVALQHRLAGVSDARLARALETNYLTRMCAPDRDVAFYVGNRGPGSGTASVLGVYWPPRY